MCGNIVCLAAALLGVDARWPPLPDGGLQYVIQIEPLALHRRESGANEAVRSYVPPYVKDIRAYQIVMGTQRLAKNVPTPNVHSPMRAGVDTDWVPLPAGGVECRVWIKPEMLDELEKPGRVIEGKIPANVKKLSVFTITVGAKPPAAGSPTTNEVNPPGSVEVKVDQLPADPLPGSPITPPQIPERSSPWPPLPVSIVPPPSRLPYTPKAQTIPNAAPSPPPSEAAPPDMPTDPDVFKPDAGSRQMPVQPANHLRQSETAVDDRPQAKADSNSMAKKESSPQEPAKSWMPLTVALVGLSASLGGNVFLLWFMQGFRSRYRVLLRRMGEVGGIVRSCVRELETAGY
ncbi:MAG: hypothetical protein ACYTG0_47255 [Planctomycetota bacterium]|jgi:hypothetical protein